MRRILVTGGAGFIGSNFVRHMLETHDDVKIVNADALTYAGNLENLSDIEKDARYAFVKCDIGEKNQVEAIFSEHRFDAVINFAAESHVDRSLHLGADTFIRTNVLGTQVKDIGNHTDVELMHIPRYIGDRLLTEEEHVG